MEILHLISEIRSPFLSAFFQFVTLLGEQTLLVPMICVLYWCVNKKLAYGVCVSFFLSALLVQGLKIALRVDRPWVVDPLFLPVESAIHSATGYSFPSGHTQSAAAVFGYLGFTRGRKAVAALCFALVALIGFSRLYLGVHTPADVICSLVLTLAVAWFTIMFLRRERADGLILGVLALFSGLMMVFAVALRSRGVIETAYAADALKAAGACAGCAAGLWWERRHIRFSVATRSVWQQLPKALLGIGGLFAIQEGGRMLLGKSLAAETLRYFFVALWALAGYPLCFRRVYGECCKTCK